MHDYIMKNIIDDKSFEFAVRIVKLSNYLKNDKKEYTLSNQILKSGTSIGANVAESKNAQSNSDFVSKMSIALKETSETDYWLRLLFATEYINKEQFDSLHADCMEIYKVLSSIVVTSKNKI